VRFLFAALCIAAVGCRDRGPAPRLDVVEPAECYNDEALALVLRGSFEVPVKAELDDLSHSGLALFGVRLVSGDQVIDLPAGGAFRGPGQLETALEAGTPTGVYSVQVTDPWGRSTTRPDALTVRFRVPPDGGSPDAGSTDAGSTDAGSTDAGSPDGGSIDGGSIDGGPIDIDPPDAGPVRAPPEPRFTIYGQYGDLAIGVQGADAGFDAGASTDTQTPATELSVSWHFNGAATSLPDSPPWTPWTTVKTAGHTPTSGIQTVVLAAKDADQDVGYFARAMSVVPRVEELCFVTTAIARDDGAVDCSHNGKSSNGPDDLLSLDEAVRIAGNTAGPQTIFLYARPDQPPVTFQGDPLTLGSSMQLVGMPGVVIQRELVIGAVPITLIGLDIAGPGGKVTVPAGLDAHLVDSRVRNTSLAVAGDLTAERTRFEQCTGACIVVNDVNAELTVSHSTFRGAGAGHAIDAIQCGWRTATVFSVDLLGNTFSGFFTAIRVGSGCVRPTRIVHQTFHGNGVAIEYLGGADHVLRNNIFTAQQVTPVQGCTVSFASRSDHWLFANAANGCIGSDLRVLSENPQYVSSAKEDFRLRHGSPAIDAAANLDLDVNGPAPNNFQGVAPDFGARETY
jgi:hypothetical protein